MATTLVRGKYVISKVTGPDSAVVVSDGAVLQRDGEIVEVGTYDDLKDRYQVDEVIGSPSYIVMPGLVNDHFHVGLTPFQLGAPDLPLELWGLSRMRAKDVDPYTDDLLVGLRQLATKYETGIHIHLQETVYQKLYGLHAWDNTPLQHLRELEFLGSDVVCGHGVWVTDEDIETMASTGTVVCHNASSNLRLQSGIAPVNELLQKGIRIALGSDEAGLNDDKDMLQEMRLALKIHRVPGVENTPPTAHQVFQMATVNGAYASSFGNRIGTLEPEKRADMVLMSLENIEEPYLDPDVSIVDAVVHRGRSINVDTVIIDGEVVMRGRKLTRVDEESILSEITRSMSRAPLPHELERRDLAEKVEPYLRKFFEGTMEPSERQHYHYNAR